MTISRAVAEGLCTKAEFQLVEASFPPAIKELTISKITRKIAACRKHLGKWRDLLKKQERELTGKMKSGKITPLNPVARTRKKVQIFTETIERFEKFVTKLEEKAKKEEIAAKKALLKKKNAVKSKAQPPKTLGRKGKKKHDVPDMKQIKARNKTISSHMRSSNKRNQAKRDRR